MKDKKLTKIRKFRSIFVSFLMFSVVFSNIISVFCQTLSVNAIENDTLPTAVDTAEQMEEVTDNTSSDTNSTINDFNSASQTSSVDQNNTTGGEVTKNVCKTSLGALGWVICPIMEKVSEAVDWLYGMIQSLLLINPIKAEDGSPIYEIWKYCLGVANVVFVIFLLIVIYSQITGLGITNYGIKKVLPKLIVTAIMVNLSFLICSLAVDVSNIIGNGLRGMFDAVEQTTMSNMATADATTSAISMTDVYTSMAGGAALAVGGGAIAFEFGAIWMLIPTVLGAIVSVVTGLITIALRQAVVVLLVMIAPLAFVANILPNTEQWFQKWKKMLERMLVFYPMFSLLFGASSLAGFALIASAKGIFWVILGLAIQIFPLFFSWKMMQMSGTFLGDINTRMRNLAAKPLATNRAWADSHRQLSHQRRLATGRTPSARLMQFISNRKVDREGEISDRAAEIKARGEAYRAKRNYKRGNLDGTLSRKGLKSYERQARVMEYQSIVERNKANFNKGFGYRAASGTVEKARLDALDIRNVKASDRLRMEIERGAQIEYDNAKGFYGRIADATNAHMDEEALRAGNLDHQLHPGVLNQDNLGRYETMKQVMEGNDLDTNFILAGAAHSFNSQAQIVRGKFNDLFSYTAPTQDLVNILGEMTKSKESNAYIDPIIAGMRTLSARGDTDLLRRQMEQVLEDRKVELGTYASQSLANFCMFDVKGSDPFLRRFGKYINLETAAMYNERDPAKRRTRRDVSLDEYVNGEYVIYDDGGNVVLDDNGRPKMGKSKRKAAVLLKGTSFKDMERTAMADMNEAIRESSFSVDENGDRVFDYEKFKKNQTEIWNAIMPNIIGDQFAFLSGSEQITALGKSITGMDVKNHKFDWNDIFGETIAAQLTPEQKMDYIEFLHKRTGTFLGGQVPSQIAKTKTDILEAVRNQYALFDEVREYREMEEEERLRPGTWDPHVLEERRRSISAKLDPVYKATDDEYRAIETERIDAIRKEFIGSYKEDALKGFVKMHHKGYQGEAKDGLIQLLNPDMLYEQFFGRGADSRERRRRQDDDDDDGMPVDTETEYDSGSLGHEEIRNSIESIFETYRGVRGSDVATFWNEVRPLLLEIPGASMAGFIDEIENSLGQYTNVADLYAYIVNRLFGGFD